MAKFPQLVRTSICYITILLNEIHLSLFTEWTLNQNKLPWLCRQKVYLREPSFYNNIYVEHFGVIVDAITPFINISRADVDFCHQGSHTENAKIKWEGGRVYSWNSTQVVIRLERAKFVIWPEFEKIKCFAVLNVTPKHVWQILCCTKCDTQTSVTDTLMY
jgi:hypothetical protein